MLVVYWICAFDCAFTILSVTVWHERMMSYFAALHTKIHRYVGFHIAEIIVFSEKLPYKSDRQVSVF